jgi:YHS domain-containing protein
MFIGGEKTRIYKMPICAECGEKVSYFNYKWDISSQNYFCSDECKSKFREKKDAEKEQKSWVLKKVMCLS